VTPITATFLHMVNIHDRGAQTETRDGDGLPLCAVETNLQVEGTTAALETKTAQRLGMALRIAGIEKEALDPESFNAGFLAGYPLTSSHDV